MKLDDLSLLSLPLSRTMTNEELVGSLLSDRIGVGEMSPELVAAFRSVDRGAFFPAGAISPDRVYSNEPCAVNTESYGLLHQSAPSIYRIVLDALDLQPGDSFLNVGSGTGYLSCLAAQLIGPTAENVGVEVRKGSAAMSRQAFRQVCGEDSDLNLRVYNENIFNCDMANSMKFSKIYVGTQITGDQLMSMKRLMTPRGTLVAPVDCAFVKLVADPDSSEGGCITMFGAVMFADICPPSDPGVTFFIPPPMQIWTPVKHRAMQMPQGFTEAARTLLLIEYRCRHQPKDKVWLPVECWLHIISMMNRSWFFPPLAKPLPSVLSQTAQMWSSVVDLPRSMWEELFPDLSHDTLAYIESRCGDLRRSLEADSFGPFRGANPADEIEDIVRGEDADYRVDEGEVDYGAGMVY
eukprot:m.181815 g.181815  ORF g.181815 m.181815 type:complete len:408 (-) comp15367_c0_seq1:172-1395(-)